MIQNICRANFVPTINAVVVKGKARPKKKIQSSPTLSYINGKLVEVLESTKHF